MNAKHIAFKIFALTLSALMVAACGRTDETIGQRVDGAIDDTKVAAQKAAAQATTAVEKALGKTADSAQDNKGKASETLEDAAITTSITASIAKDPDLSAFKIDVTTTNGNVAMHGSAPSEQARARAMAIAQSVKGVMKVDNQLTIKPKS